MLLHHAGDFIRKASILRFRQQAWSASLKPDLGPGELRMLKWERIQHALLAGSFIVLVITGFALHYPSAWWAEPFLIWEKSWPVRGTIHRAAAAVMVGVSVLHLLLLIRDRELRRRWLEFIPKVRDVREAIAGMRWRVGLSNFQPYRSPHSYIEKAEYWAVVWGTLVMAATGTLLWLNNWTLQHLPKWGIDLSRTIHFYEAVLATLAIIVWHFYMVIFDPEVYPMDPAWFSGHSPRRHAHYDEEDEENG
jgi:cytochrome b subunit of formate dehydrogenase